MTEMEKARAGLEFIRGDAQLRAIRERAESLCFQLNHMPPEEGEKRKQILRQLIPQGFDTGDLIIVLLLLLIAGDSQESRSNALLTLALYFIL